MSVFGNRPILQPTLAAIVSFVTATIATLVVTGAATFYNDVTVKTLTATSSSVGAITVSGVGGGVSSTLLRVGAGTITAPSFNFGSAGRSDLGIYSAASGTIDLVQYGVSKAAFGSDRGVQFYGNVTTTNGDISSGGGFYPNTRTGQPNAGKNVYFDYNTTKGIFGIFNIYTGSDGGPIGMAGGNNAAITRSTAMDSFVTLTGADSYITMFKNGGSEKVGIFKDGSFRPVTSNAVDLGAPEKTLRNMYASGTIYSVNMAVSTSTVDVTYALGTGPVVKDTVTGACYRLTTASGVLVPALITCAP